MRNLLLFELKTIPTGLSYAWRQHRSFNERDLLSVQNLQSSVDYRTLEHTNRLYSSADRGRYDLQRFERLEHYPLTRTSRLDVNYRNSLNRAPYETGYTQSGLSDTRRTDYGMHNVGNRQKHPQIIVGGRSGGELSAFSNQMNNTNTHTNQFVMSGERAEQIDGEFVDAQDARHLTERRIKKTVRFGGHDDSPTTYTLNTTTTTSLMALTTTTTTSTTTSIGTSGNLLPPVTSILPSTAVDVGAANILASGKLSSKTTANLRTSTQSWSQSDSERQWSQDSITKDSGFETSSNFTSSEESNRGGDTTKV